MQHQDIGYLLNRAARQIRLRLGEALAETALTPQQAAVMLAIARSPGKSLTPRAVAGAIETDAATTSGLLDRLTRDCWLMPHPNPNDGRSRLFVLTERAEQILPAVMVAAQGVSSAVTSSFTAVELKSLVSLLQRLGDQVETASSKKAGSL